jgi:site-specific DNA recombinase
MRKKKQPIESGIKTAIVYVRVSSKEQLDGTSLTEQERLCKEYCERSNLEVVRMFIEEGESAKSANRPAFLEAIEFCRKNKISAFVVWKLDRFARNTTDHYAVREKLVRHGTRLHSVTEPVNDEATGKVMEAILAAISEFDNDIRSQRCKGGMMGRIRSGIYPYKPPTGYICQQNKKHGKAKTEPDPIDPVLFPLIKRALRGYKEERYTQKDMVNVLNEGGYERHMGKKATFSLVDRMLRNHLEFYAGLLYCSDDDKYYEGLHEAMITEDEMNQIIAVRDGKTKRATKKDKFNPEFPLRRTILCGHCNNPLTGSASRGRHGKYYASYHCHNKDCENKGKTIRKKLLESDFLKLLDKVTPTQEFLDYIHRVVINKQETILNEQKKEAEERDKALEAVKKKRAQIYQLAENEVYTPEIAKERLAEVESEFIAVQIEQNEQRIDYLEVKFEKEYMEQSILDISQLWLDLAPEYRRRFQKLVFPAGISYTKNNGFGTAILGSIFTLYSESSYTDSVQVTLRGIEPDGH